MAQGLAAPCGMAVGADGDLPVVETATGRLLAIDPDTGEQAVVAQELAVSPQIPEGSAPMVVDVAVGLSGAI